MSAAKVPGSVCSYSEFSSFFVLNSGSYFSHSLTALYGVVFALFGLRYIERGEIWCAVAAGACIGLMGLTRTQNAVIFIAPFAIALAMTQGRRLGLFWFGLGGAPFLAALLAFNGAVTGDPLLPVQNWHKPERFGAPSVSTIKHTLRHFRQLYIWTSPVLLFGFIVAFVTALRRRGVDFTDWIMPITVIFFLLYNTSGGEQYGPRYYFEAWPFAVLTILKVIDPILFGAEHGARAEWVSSALIASLLFEIGYLPVRLEREHRVVMQRQDMYTQAESAGLDNAIVIIASNVGVIRPIAAAGSRAQRTPRWRTEDHLRSRSGRPERNAPVAVSQAKSVRIFQRTAGSSALSDGRHLFENGWSTARKIFRTGFQRTGFGLHPNIGFQRHLDEAEKSG